MPEMDGTIPPRNDGAAPEEDLARAWLEHMRRYPPAHHKELRVVDGRWVIPVGELAEAVIRGRLPATTERLNEADYRAACPRVDYGRAPERRPILPAQLTMPLLALSDPNGELIVVDGRRRANQLLDKGEDSVLATIIGWKQAEQYFVDVDGLSQRERNMLTAQSEAPLRFGNSNSATTGIDIVAVNQLADKKTNDPRATSAKILDGLLLTSGKSMLQRLAEQKARKKTPGIKAFDRHTALSGLTTRVGEHEVKVNFWRAVETLDGGASTASRHTLEAYSKETYGDPGALLDQLQDQDDVAAQRQFVLLSRSFARAKWWISGLKKLNRSLQKKLGIGEFLTELTADRRQHDERWLNLRALMMVTVETGVNQFDLGLEDPRHWELGEWAKRAHYLGKGIWLPPERVGQCEQLLMWLAVDASLPDRKAEAVVHDGLLLVWLELLQLLYKLPAPASAIPPGSDIEFQSALSLCLVQCLQALRSPAAHQ